MNESLSILKVRQALKLVVRFLFRSIVWMILLFVSVGVVFNVMSYGWNEHYNHPDRIKKQRASLSRLKFFGYDTLEIDGLRFAYYEKGNRKKNPLIVIPMSFTDSLEQYQEIVDKLASRGYWVVAYAQRGIYPTDIPKEETYDIEQLGKDLIQLMSALKAEKAFIIGHDVGALTGYAAAWISPQSVQGLVTVSAPHPGVFISQYNLFKSSPFIGALPFGFISQWWVKKNNFAFLDEFAAMRSPAWKTDGEQHMSQVKSELSQAGRLKAVLEHHEALFFQTYRQKQQLLDAAVNVPTLQWVGADDLIFGPQEYEHTEALFLKDYQRIEVVGAGHFLHFEKMDWFLAATTNFFKQALIADKNKD